MNCLIKTGFEQLREVVFLALNNCMKPCFFGSVSRVLKRDF